MLGKDFPDAGLKDSEGTGSTLGVSMLHRNPCLSQCVSSFLQCDH